MKHRGSFPHRTDAPDRRNAQRDEQTNEEVEDPSFRPFQISDEV